MPAKQKALRPPFIIRTTDVPEFDGRYPNTTEVTGHGRRVGRVAGLLKTGLWVERLAPGERTSYPHAHSRDEEWVYVMDGRVDAWVDGGVHPMRAGDLAAFPAGTGIAHTFINNSTKPAMFLVGGDANQPDDRVWYPLHSHRRGELPWSRWWENAPKRTLGAHDGLSTRMRREKEKAEKLAAKEVAAKAAKSAAAPAMKAAKSAAAPATKAAKSAAAPPPRILKPAPVLVPKVPTRPTSRKPSKRNGSAALGLQRSPF